jgi:glycosyltransferase involved in cell wall biosynthesis
VTIYNGVDLAKFSPSSTPRPNTVGGALNLLAVGSIVQNKNVLNLIHSIAICRKQGLDVRVNWAGESGQTQSARRYWTEAKDLVDEYDLGGAWSWLGQRSDISELLRSCDALIHPSFYEGLPNSVCEAMASGRPVLASDVCDHPLLIKEGKNGLLFDPSKPGSIAAGITAFCDLSITERQNMGVRGREVAEQDLSIERAATEYLNLVERRREH